ncbi:membrane protein [Halarcobacter anaerophilus]|uniref:membrane protein n=1 Tax=Halarcobacter anaerophilus TaxID=877500 RepID=UPI0005CB71B4|nr:membrane protein [Halarcobacter anaerophilus]
MSLSDNIYKIIFYTTLFVVLSILFFTVDTLSISYKEALNVFINNSLLSIITNTSIAIFGQNDYALRAPFILFYFFSILLMYRFTDNLFKKESDRLLSILIFMLLPGLLSASLLVNSAIIVTFFTLLYLNYLKSTKRHCYILLILFLFIDNSFAIFFLALFFYALKDFDKKLLISSFILFCVSMALYGFDTGGKPRGFLVDTFAIYASIFSPLLFIYFFYTIYREGVKGNRHIVWYISATSLAFSLLFSFRQRIYIEDYAPFVVIFLPYMVKNFLQSYRVRLPQFRRKHRYIASITLFILLLNATLTIFNKPLYLFLENPKKHFAYNYNIAKELAAKLKKNNINEIESDQQELLLRLKFYGIKEGNRYFVSTNKKYYYDKKISIKYLDKTVATAYIIKN